MIKSKVDSIGFGNSKGVRIGEVFMKTGIGLIVVGLMTLSHNTKFYAGCNQESIDNINEVYKIVKNNKMTKK